MAATRPSQLSRQKERKPATGSTAALATCRSRVLITAFLRDSYRVMRACLGYFVAYVGEPDENGRYHIVPSVCHEQERSKANHRENS